MVPESKEHTPKSFLLTGTHLSAHTTATSLVCPQLHDEHTSRYCSAHPFMINPRELSKAALKLMFLVTML